jgi:hypothetical protein
MSSALALGLPFSLRGLGAFFALRSPSPLRQMSHGSFSFGGCCGLLDVAPRGRTLSRGCHASPPILVVHYGNEQFIAIPSAAD